ncbi:hydantoinase B/oxoprolinase family protein [Bacillus sp. FJAT-29937]|uniref:hydantoinase B/oxoprolinase family protein n=1 Tax=Bacillus sp. FJAT-29937 TaxID=1720553 RepID=UPI000835FA02|nr:hydantoinase B/oxoprolinase family protein [Bacillus sp. FJAT-29937]
MKATSIGTKKVDPILIEVIRNGFVAAADEMKINLARTAYNPIIYEVLDFSVGLFDHNGDMVSQAAGLPIFLGNLPPSVKQIISDIGKENMTAGDVYLINDTYTVGTHLNDVVVCSPIFLEENIIGFAASRAHWLDIGAVSPGGWTTDTTEIYQEGIRLRSIQLMKSGVMNRDVYQILRDNVRFTESVMGDLRAQIAASHTGERRMLEIVKKYGLETVQVAIQKMFLMEEKATRAAIAAIPDGEYKAESFMDDDGVGVKNPKVCVNVKIKGEEMIIDLTGSAEQCLGPINCGYAATLSGARIALKAVTNPLSPVNEGTFRPLTLTIPENCMFNAKHPAPSAVYGLVLMTLCDTIFKALATAIPERIPAAHYGDVCAVFIFGDDPSTGVPYLHTEAEGGGWGANRFRDGENVMIAIADGDTRNVPVEIVESKFPFRIERYEVRQDSGGPGRFRGGLGHFRDYKIINHDPKFTTTQERSECPPWGLFGGQTALHNRVVVNPGTQKEEIIQKTTGYQLKDGDILSVQTGGGGGYGNPLDRTVDEVRVDVIRGYVSLKAAEECYGVIIDPISLSVDQIATNNKRKQLKALS